VNNFKQYQVLARYRGSFCFSCFSLTNLNIFCSASSSPSPSSAVQRSDCMAMSTTPIPLPYVQMAKIFTLVFLFTLPAAMVDSLGWSAVMATFILSLGYLGLDAIGREKNQIKVFLNANSQLHPFALFLLPANSFSFFFRQSSCFITVASSVFSRVFFFFVFLFHSQATEMEMPFGTDINDLPVMETALKVERGVRVLLSQLEGEDLEAYDVRPFFGQQSI